MKNSLLLLIFALASATLLVAQESQPKRKTRPPTDIIVEGALIWSRGGTAIVKIPRETIEATLADGALTVKAGGKNIPIQILPAGSKVFIKLREDKGKFTILELGQDKSDVSPIIPPPAQK